MNIPDAEAAGSLAGLVAWHRREAAHAAARAVDKRGSFHTKRDAELAKAFHERAAETVRQAAACLTRE